MPRTKPFQCPFLKISLDNPQHLPVVGGWLTGTVVLKKPSHITKIGDVCLTFSGRTKTKWLKKGADGRIVTYRARNPIFEMQIVLHSYTISDEDVQSCSWPFELQIPNPPHPEVTDGDTKPPVPMAEITRPNLPTTYYSWTEWSGWSNTSVEAFVEYTLRVDLFKSTRHQANLSLYRSTIPVILRSSSTEKPVENIQLRARKRTLFVSSRKLLPEELQVPFAKREKIKRFFTSPSDPRFAFNLRVVFPSIVQLYHPDPITFQVTLIPELEGPKTTIDTALPLPEVRITTLSLSLQATTRTSVQGSFDAHFNEKTFSYIMCENTDLPKTKILIPTSPSKEPYVNESGFLDLGEMLSLQLTRRKSKIWGRDGAKFGKPLTPSFETRNISVSYRFKFNIGIECVSELANFTNDYLIDPCVVLAPAESQLQTDELGWMGKEITESMSHLEGISTDLEVANQACEIAAAILRA
ncbi:hypothetical protein BJ875DRAFT_471662 [Amylocarpus encephaloides]|uniref:Arrestin-like N-terminal domain-containing protein n=1 Tax=Amylocarpus encephaloides TaxID=45428 RepID=A0A9P7YBI8_9HELO|nr:hypothetical protein BJ875DRAFT_471662 [Amylocarpus encephaloides]